MFFRTPTELISKNCKFFFVSEDDISWNKVSDEDYMDILIYVRNMGWLPDFDSHGSIIIENGIMTIEGDYNTFGYGYQYFKRKYIVGDFGQCIYSHLEDGFTEGN